jgi:hypothetical protein
LNIATAFNSQSLYHLTFTIYIPFSLTVTLNLSVTFLLTTSQPFTLHEILSKSPKYDGVNVYSTFPFLNNVLADTFKEYFSACGVAIKTLFIAKDLAPFFALATAFTVNVPYSL